MKGTGVYPIGYFILISGLLVRIGMPWSLIAVVVTIGIGIMFVVASSVCKGNIQIDRK